MSPRFAALSLSLLASASPAAAQHTQITPHIDATQVLSAELGKGGDTFTYTTLGAGLDASIQTRRIEVQVSYDYQRRIDYDGALANNDTHSGLATARARVSRDVTLEAGAIATRSRADIRGDALSTNQGNIRNVSQIYSAYAGPSLATRVGPAFVNAAYRFGYTKAETPYGTGVDAGAAPLDRYDDSRVHVATASAGVKSGTVLPIGVTVSGSFTREDAGQLEQRFEGKYGRGDVVLPVSRQLAATAGVGYEKIAVSQRDAVRDASGRPVLDRDGRFISDRNAPRRLAYDLDGVFWDAGVIWRPSVRTFLEARVGRRYNSTSYTGSFSHQFGRGSGVQIGVYDSVQTWGQQLNGTLSRLPTSFISSTDPFGNQFSGCIYGTTGAAAGGCLNNVFASTVTSAYRSRGVTGVAVFNRGSTHFGVGGGYARRSFLAPDTGVAGVSIDGSWDESYYGQLFSSTEIGRNGSLSGSVFGSYTASSLADADGVFGWGAETAYTHRFGQLGATATLGIFGFDRNGDSIANAQALLGLSYGF